MRRRSALLAALAAAGVLGAAGCADDAPVTGAPDPELRVSAASSLKAALEAYAPEHRGARLRLSFGGTDQLAGQIRAGARPDVLLAADVTPAALAAEGLVETPVPFARNRLVLAVPARGGRVRTVADLGDDGVRIALGNPSVPVGRYADELVAALPAPLRRRVRANVRSREPDVAGVVGKVAQGAVDAGIVYVTDVRASDGRLRAIPLPAGRAPTAYYVGAVVRGTRHAAAAAELVASLRAGAGARALRAAGFLDAGTGP